MVHYPTYEPSFASGGKDAATIVTESMQVSMCTRRISLWINEDETSLWGDPSWHYWTTSTFKVMKNYKIDNGQPLNSSGVISFNCITEKPGTVPNNNAPA